MSIDTASTPSISPAALRQGLIRVRSQISPSASRARTLDAVIVSPRRHCWMGAIRGRK
jgi:hypothetical protein